MIKNPPDTAAILVSIGLPAQNLSFVRFRPLALNHMKSKGISTHFLQQQTRYFAEEGEKKPDCPYPHSRATAIRFSLDF